MTKQQWVQPNYSLLLQHFLSALFLQLIEGIKLKGNVMQWYKPTSMEKDTKERFEEQNSDVHM